MTNATRARNADGEAWVQSMKSGEAWEEKGSSFMALDGDASKVNDWEVGGWHVGGHHQPPCFPVPGRCCLLHRRDALRKSPTFGLSGHSALLPSEQMDASVSRQMRPMRGFCIKRLGAAL